MPELKKEQVAEKTEEVLVSDTHKSILDSLGGKDKGKHIFLEKDEPSSTDKALDLDNKLTEEQEIPKESAELSSDIDTLSSSDDY